MNPFTNTKLIGINVKNSDYITRDPNIPRGHPLYVMSRSELMDFAHNPHGWLNESQEEEDDGDETKATKWGSLIDVMTLTPERFNHEYALTPKTYRNGKGIETEWTNKSSTCRDWVSEVHKQGMTAISTDLHQQAIKAVKVIHQDARAMALINCSKRQMMITSNYTDERTAVTVPVKILLDLVPNHDDPIFGKSLADLKTSRGADQFSWVKYVSEHGYDVQAAFYMDVYCALFPTEERIEWRHVIQESAAPYEMGRRLLSSEFMEIGRMKYRSALRDYCVCLATNTWPGYDDYGDTFNGWNLTQPKEWMANTIYGMGLKLPKEVEPAKEADPDNIP